MEYLITSHEKVVSVKDIATYIVRFICGMAITFALFALMAKLVEQKEVGAPTIALQEIGFVIFEEPDDKTITKQTIKPLEKIEQPPKLPLPTTEIAESKNEFSTELYVNNKVDPITVEPQLGVAKQAYARPLVRVPPRYPSDAAKKGIEGWVELGFTIHTDGSVINISVIDSQPKRIFDRAAIRALQAWKYKPSVTQGNAVQQSGLSVVLDFKLDPQ